MGLPCIENAGEPWILSRTADESCDAPQNDLQSLQKRFGNR
jgi:hypothetical protein